MTTERTERVEEIRGFWQEGELPNDAADAANHAIGDVHILISEIDRLRARCEELEALAETVAEFSFVGKPDVYGRMPNSEAAVLDLEARIESARDAARRALESEGGE